MKNNIHIIKASVVDQDTDAIVNAANYSLLGGGGVDGAIHKAAGPDLLEACKLLGCCPVGGAKITKGYNLKAKHVIHTVGPVFGGTPTDGDALAACYRNSLNLARLNDLHSISFCGISTGVYGYPVRDATRVALWTVNDWLEKNADYDIEIRFCCFTDEEYSVYTEEIQNLVGPCSWKESKTHYIERRYGDLYNELANGTVVEGVFAKDKDKYVKGYEEALKVLDSIKDDVSGQVCERLNWAVDCVVYDYGLEETYKKYKRYKRNLKNVH